MMKQTTLAALIAATALSACATAPAKIIPTPVTREIACTEKPRIDAELTAATDAQNKAAISDKIAATTAFLVFLPAVVMIKGNKLKPEIARLKGEAAALQAKGC